MSSSSSSSNGKFVNSLSLQRRLLTNLAQQRYAQIEADCTRYSDVIGMQPVKDIACHVLTGNGKSIADFTDRQKVSVEIEQSVTRSERTIRESAKASVVDHNATLRNTIAELAGQVYAENASSESYFDSMALLLIGLTEYMEADVNVSFADAESLTRVKSGSVLDFAFAGNGDARKSAKARHDEATKNLALAQGVFDKAKVSVGKKADESAIDALTSAHAALDAAKRDEQHARESLEAIDAQTAFSVLKAGVATTIAHIGMRQVV